ncbi:MAG TPA: hypothetical protein EYN06_09955 [Myxococcales bacterium]|nr:hypothetical protein [Myxococcales bacterium]HIN86793.1 hypothetical protein [Myxococcales bacterium]
MSCGLVVPVPLDFCLHCGGQPLYAQNVTGEWGVELGPVTSMEFREEVVSYLHFAMAGVDPNELEDRLKKFRCRAVSGLSQELAEAFVACLNPQKTAASAVFGSAQRVGLSGVFRNGLPIIGMAAGAAGALLVDPIGWAIGGGAAVALGVFNAAQRPVDLGSLRSAPSLPTELVDLPARLRHLWPTLDAVGKERLRDALFACFSILAQLMNEDDLISLSLGGAEGGMGRCTTGLIQESIRVAELLGTAQDTESRAKQIASLTQISEAALKTQEELNKVQNGMKRGDESAVDQINNELELMQRTVEQIKKVV